MGLTLSEKDRRYLERLKESDVLCDVVGSQLDLHNGANVVMCCDGHQIDDRFQFFSKQLDEAGGERALHIHTRHAGSLRIAENSPLNKPGRTTDLDLIDEIFEGVALKQIYTVWLSMHAPCGKVIAHGLPLEEALILHVAGKKRLRIMAQQLRRERQMDLRQDVTFATIVHVDWGNGKKRYYHLKGSELLAFRAREMSTSTVTA